MLIPRISLTALTLGFAPIASAEVKVSLDHIPADRAEAAFKLATVPAPRRGDAAAKATFTVIEGERDRAGGNLAVLNDGKLPKNGDEPASNFFFRPATDGGRLLADLGSTIEVKQVNTYSWHGGARGPQVYKVYGSEGTAEGFAAKPQRPVDPAKAGWTLVASVDTRPKAGEPAGQHAVSITDTTGALGKFRYLLFDVSRTEDADAFGNTFFSEIDVIDRAAPETPEEPSLKQITESGDIDGGFRYTIDTTETPDLTEWAHTELVPVIKKWYPILVEMLPSEGYTAPRTFSITFTDEYKGVAATMGNRVVCSPPWYRKQLKGEALGSIVHELVHVVQQYGRARTKPGATRAPGWLVEGLCDYIRFYLYEPELRGADIRPRNAANAKYDGSYRVTGNFLHFVVNKYDKDLIKELNAAMREGRYTPEIWKTRTGLTAEELSVEWKKALENPAPATPATPATPAPAPAPAKQP